MLNGSLSVDLGAQQERWHAGVYALVCVSCDSGRKLGWDVGWEFEYRCLGERLDTGVKDECLGGWQDIDRVGVLGGWENK